MEHKGLGPDLFETLRAEDESSWLDACFVPPRDFERILAPRSTVIFGAAGTGKTVLYQQVIRMCRGTEDTPPKRLIVLWPMFSALAPVPPADIEGIKRLTQELFSRIALALLEYLARWPNFYFSIRPWVRLRLTWFLQKYFQGGVEFSLAPLLEQVTPEGAACVKEMLTNPVPEQNSRLMTPEETLAELGTALVREGIKGIWVLWDGIPVSGPNVLAIKDTLKAFLTTLSLFENQALVYKLWIPDIYRADLLQAGGIARRRIEQVVLEWEPEDLRRMVEKRLTLALGDRLALEDLCSVPQFIRWIYTVGGSSPRDWIDQLLPFVKRYWQTRQPADEVTWKLLMSEHPPRLHVDEAQKQVWVGGRQIDLEDIPPKVFEMLMYLYQNAGRIISKAELYYRSYLDLPQIPRPGDKEYLGPKQYEGQIDTSLWRLRKRIEPVPEHPVLLVTRRGHGVQLNVRW